MMILILLLTGTVAVAIASLFALFGMMSMMFDSLDGATDILMKIGVTIYAMGGISMIMAFFVWMFS